jgi:TRAP-type C4-dicarboxylate transport system permease small subunit
MGESDREHTQLHEAVPQPALRWLERLAFVVGSIGLLIAMFADALAVLGRHLGLPVLGSIEIVQASVVLLAAAAMLGATLKGAHARVHLVVDRLGGRGRQWLLRCADVLSGIVFVVFAIGSIWIAYELWGGYEHSELLHIPLRWLRVLWIVAALAIAAVFFVNATRRGRSR